VKFLYIALLIIVSTVLIFGQNQDASKHDELSGLVIDQTTPEEAIKLLGSPKRDNVDKIDVQTIERWISPQRKEKVFRILSFEKAKGLQKIELAFLNNRLVLIHFVLDKRIAASDLANVYRITFIPIVNKLDENFHPSDYERYKSNIGVANFPDSYSLIAVSNSSFISAKVFNNGADPKADYSGMVTPRTHPSLSGGTNISSSPLVGKVTEIQIISRKLEAKKQ
jgi:hypothetical protein